MKNRLVSMALASILLMSTVASVAAHGTGSNHYKGDCAGGAQQSRGLIWKRSPANLTGVKVNIRAQQLHPCTNPGAGEISKSLMLVTMAGRLGSIAGPFQATHNGIMKSHNDPDQTYFGYTPNNNAVMAVATWVDFDNNGVPDNPVAGVTYTFLIQFVDYGNEFVPHNWYIRYRVTRQSDGATDAVNTVPAGGQFTGNNGNLSQPNAWWGCEAGGSTASALGTPDDIGTYPRAYMDGSAYLSTGGSYIYTQDSTIVSGAAADPAWVANPSYYTYGQNQNGHNQDGDPLDADKVWCMTESHQ